MAKLCGVVYERPAASVPSLLRCQYLAGHPAERHSWSTVKTSDENEQAEAVRRSQAAAAKRSEASAFEAVQLLEYIEAGRFDSILEALLNAAHNRKRTLRGVRGFPNLERRFNGQ